MDFFYGAIVFLGVSNFDRDLGTWSNEVEELLTHELCINPQAREAHDPIYPLSG